MIAGFRGRRGGAELVARAQGGRRALAGSDAPARRRSTMLAPRRPRADVHVHVPGHGPGHVHAHAHSPDLVRSAQTSSVQTRPVQIDPTLGPDPRLSTRSSRPAPPHAPLAFRLSPLASRPPPLASRLGHFPRMALVSSRPAPPYAPLASRLSPLASRLSPPASRLTPLASRLWPPPRSQLYVAVATPRRAAPRHAPGTRPWRSRSTAPRLRYSLPLLACYLPDSRYSLPATCLVPATRYAPGTCYSLPATCLVLTWYSPGTCLILATRYSPGTCYSLPA